MAIGARHPLAGVCPGVNGEPAMVEHRSQPGRGCVAGCASGREVGCLMVRIARAQVVGLVTRITVGRGSFVHAVDMTFRARNGYVCAGKRERRLAVVKLRTVPGTSRVANLAVGGESRRFMVRIGGAVVVVQVTGHARGLKIGEVPIHVTGHTWERCVFTGERELRFGVIEGGWTPAAGGMTDRTIGRKSGCFVVGIVGLVVVADMAGGAVRGRAGESAVDVACRASYGCVKTGERKLGEGPVIEMRVIPTRG